MATKPRPARARSSGALIVAGVGINGAGQTTLEALAAMQRADTLFYVVAAPATELWLQQLNANAISLAPLYAEGKNRDQTYREMVETIVAAVRRGQNVCVAFYGHPGVFATAPHWAIALCRSEGYPAKMLPGISADACLFADLGFNPGELGVQHFDATDFLLYRRRFDPTSGLLLWQVGILGESSPRQSARARRQRLATLGATLSRYYPTEHPVIFYEAPTFPSLPPRIRRVRLSRLAGCRIAPITLTYVPPLGQRRPVAAIAQWCRSA